MFLRGALTGIEQLIEPCSWADATQVTDLGVSDWLWRKHTGRSPSVDEIRAVANAYESALARELDHHPNRFSIVPGADVLLGRLASDGWVVAIATGGWRRLAHIKLAAARISSELLLASCDDSSDRFEIFRLAQERVFPL